MAIDWGGSIIIAVSPERLWELLMHPDADTGWRAPWTRSVRALTQGPTAIGSRYESRYNFYLVVWATETSEITAMEPPRLLAWRTEGPRSSGEGRYVLEAVDGGTRFPLSATYAGRGLSRVLDGPFGRHLRRDVAPRQLAALKAMAERASR